MAEVAAPPATLVAAVLAPQGALMAPGVALDAVMAALSLPLSPHLLGRVYGQMFKELLGKN